MRFIGIRHRVKQTKAGEARPTQVCVIDPDSRRRKPARYELKEIEDDIDFTLGKFPVEWRDLTDEDDVTTLNPRHVKWRKINPDKLDEFPERHRRQIGKKSWEQAIKVASAFDGLRAGDVVAMSLGGSGDLLAHSLFLQGQKLGATVYRLPPVHLKGRRDELKRDKDDDCLTLAELVRDRRQLFYAVTERDSQVILVIDCYRHWLDAQKARIACGQRLDQRFEASVYREYERLPSNFDLEDTLKQLKANDKVYQALIGEENERLKDLESVVTRLDVYHEVFAPIEGIGLRIAARIITGVRDPMRLIEGTTLKDESRLAELRVAQKEWRDRADFHGAQREFGIKPDQPLYDKLQQIIKHCKQRGQTSRAEMFQLSLDLMREAARHKKTLKRGRTWANFRKLCGTFVREDGSFPRRRAGELADWSEEARQAFYLVGEQFNRRPDSEWGQRLRLNKERLRQRHPVDIKIRRWLRPVLRQVCVVLQKYDIYLDMVDQQYNDGAELLTLLTDLGVNEVELDHVRRVLEAETAKLNALRGPAKAEALKTITVYNPGHIHKMALWKTLGQLATHVCKAWIDLIRRDTDGQAAQKRAA